MKHLFLKISISVLIYTLIYFPAMAQIEIGFKGGYGYGQYFFQDNFQRKMYFDFIPLYNGGILFQYLNKQKIGVQASFLYTQKGWVEKTPEGGKANFLMDFTEFEFLTYLKFSKKKEHGLFIKFGPYIGYSFNNNYSRIGNIDSVLINYDSLQTAYKKFDYGVALGLSYTIKIDKSSMQIGFLFRQGLYNILNQDPNGIFQSISQGLFINMAFTVPIFSTQKQNKDAIKPD
ncbi:MAG: PorT family protein [Bacteroidales bacterium]|nr:PorT family protein [Bacteroidales bacterium]